jgi:hypothetical protein
LIDPRPAILRFDIDQRKLIDYLLNLNHADGGPKAARLLRHNFTPELLRLSLVSTASRAFSQPHGRHASALSSR